MGKNLSQSNNPSNIKLNVFIKNLLIFENEIGLIFFSIIFIYMLFLYYNFKNIKMSKLIIK